MDDVEQQRAAEMAEIAPDRLTYAAFGLFALGWVWFGIMWNFRWPGVWIAIVTMGGITYGVMRWKLKYLPRLKAELARAPRWQRGIELALAAAMFILAMLSVAAVHTSFGDFLAYTSLFGGQSFPYDEFDRWNAGQIVQSANLDGLNVDEVELKMAGAEYRIVGQNVLFYGLFAVLLLWGSLSTLIDTRRYRGTWKHWWGPTLSLTFMMMFMLPVMHVLHLFGTGYSASKIDPREVRTAATSDEIKTAVDQWARVRGYEQREFKNWRIRKDGQTIGNMRFQLLAPASWFDRYRMAWRHKVLRPQPIIFVATVSRDEPAEAYMRVEFPHVAKDTPEEAWWSAIAEELESAIQGAAASDSNVNASDDERERT